MADSVPYVIKVIHEPLAGTGDPSAVAFPLSMPSCLTQRRTADDAVSDLERVVGHYTRSLRERGLNVPEPDLPDGVGSIVWHDYSACGGGVAGGHTTREDGE